MERRHRTPVSSLDVIEEVAAAELGDARRSRRLGKVVERLAARPDASFPDAARDGSELEAMYRFLGNEHVKPEAILEPHLVASVARASEHRDVIVAHDTTHFSFEGEREGVGRVNKKDHGFWGHFALAMSREREAFGVVGLRYGTRHGASKWSGSRRITAASGEDPSESTRWPELAESVATRFGKGRVIHVMDREADWFELFQYLVERGERFVIRLAHDRLVDGGPRVSHRLAGATTKARREVELSARADGGSAKARRIHPARQPRTAELHIRSIEADIRSSTSGAMLKLNLVHVIETDPPEGCAPVEWTLVTTEPIATESDVLLVVDAYRARWTIEEFFKALKTGCAYEKRQLCSYSALLNALAVLTPIAWSLLRLRDVGRRTPEAPARRVIEPQLLEILSKIARKPLPSNPNARDVMYAIAGLAGHLTRNGDPGWITLGRGFERLLEAAHVAQALKM